MLVVEHATNLIRNYANKDDQNTNTALCVQQSAFNEIMAVIEHVATFNLMDHFRQRTAIALYMYEIKI